MIIRELTFTVPGEPVAKGRPKASIINGHVHMRTPAKTASFELLVRSEFERQFPDLEPIKGPVSVCWRAYFQIPKSWSKKKQKMAADGIIVPTKKPDTDNLAKIKDALNCVAWADDAQVVDEEVHKRYVEPGQVPRLVITIGISDKKGINDK